MGVTVAITVFVINLEQSEDAITGREAFRFESRTVRARRQLSAEHPGGVRLSSGFAITKVKVADATATKEKNFMVR